MKQHRTIFRRLAPAALAVTLLMTSATPALAVTYGNAQVMPNRTIVVDGVARTFYAINGQEVHPIYYGGTTYLPVRSIGELMNKNVDWNNDSQPTREEAFAKLIPRIHNGAVILLHSTSKTNAAILDELLTKWEDMGYRFDSLDALFA